MNIGEFIIVDATGLCDAIPYAKVEDARVSIDSGPEGRFLIAKIVDEATRATVTQTTFAKRRRAKAAAKPAPKKKAARETAT